MNQFPAMQPRLDSKKAEDSERHQANPLIGQRGIRQHSQSSECRERNYQPVHRSLAKPLGILPAGFGYAHAHLFSVCPEQLQKAKSPKRVQLWCTGKDSNLRTPLGGADLQSAGFNHSPTCAETAKLSLLTGSSYPGQPSTGFAHTRRKPCRLRNQTENRNSANTLAHENHYPSEKFLMECFWITCRAAKLLPPPCRKIVLGAGEGI
jgi:hypothetical protein